VTDPAEQRLLDLRTEVLGRLNLAGAELDQLKSARTDSTADDEHDPEGSTLAMDWSRIVGLTDAASARLDEIDTALERVSAGTYGFCLNCGKPIGDARLEALPAAELCIVCARLLT
jgi:DnaK suppressor protein